MKLFINKRMYLNKKIKKLLLFGIKNNYSLILKRMNDEKNRLYFINDKDGINNTFNYNYRWKSVSELIDFFNYNLVGIKNGKTKKNVKGKIYINKKLNIIIIESDTEYDKIYLEKK